MEDKEEGSRRTRTFLQKLRAVFIMYGLRNTGVNSAFAAGEDSIAVFRILLGDTESPVVRELGGRYVPGTYGEASDYLLMCVTISVADLLEASGASRRLHVYDTLHAIEHALAVALQHGGYKVPELNKPRYWAVFRRYENSALMGGIAQQKLRELRDEAAKKDPEHYEP